MRKVILILIIAHSSLMITNAQITQEWVARYNHPGDDSPASLTLDRFGNIYVTGTEQGSQGYDDWLTLKYNPSGNLLWANSYNGPGDNVDIAYSVAADSSGNCYVCGYGRMSFTASRFTVIKYNSTGSQQWLFRIDSTQSGANCVQVGPDNNPVVCGTNGSAIYTYKFAPSGNIIWLSIYNFGNNTGVVDLAIDRLGNVYVLAALGTNFCTIKYSSAGIQQWVNIFSGINGGIAFYPKALAVDTSGNVYVSGSNSSSVSWEDFVTIKYNSGGVQQWAVLYGSGPNKYDRPSDIAVDPAGNCYITGWSDGSTSSNTDIATVKYNTDGIQQWVIIYNGAGNANDKGNSIRVDKVGNSYITGLATINTNIDFITIKYSNIGAQQWLATYNGSGNNTDNSYAIELDNRSNVYIAGMSRNTGNFDFVTIKYSPLVGIHTISTEIPNQFSLSQNYPNPFNPSSKVKFQMSKLSHAKLVVFDITGREIETLVDEELQPGTYEVDWDGSNFSSGIYYYALQTEGYTETRKMVLMK